MNWEKVESTNGFIFWKTYDLGIVQFNFTDQLDGVETGNDPGKTSCNYRSLDAAKRKAGLLPALTNNPLAGVTAFRLGR